jgi:hypothetical protein
VIVAVWAGVEAAVVAENEATIAFAGTTTDAGTVTPDALVETPTVTPPDGAEELIVTVHTEAAPAVMLVGLQVIPDTCRVTEAATITSEAVFVLEL